jgi:hypothetical protein
MTVEMGGTGKFCVTDGATFCLRKGRNIASVYLGRHRVDGECGHGADRRPNIIWKWECERVAQGKAVVPFKHIEGWGRTGRIIVDGTSPQRLSRALTVRQGASSFDVP